MSEPATAVVIPGVPAKIRAIQQVLEKQKDKIAQTCGTYLDPERLMRVAMATIYKTPKLQECDPWSIAGALMEAAQIGVEVGGPQDEAYLIPRKNSKSGTMQACFQISYKGLVKVAIDSGAALSVNAGVAHENDQFDYSLGTEPLVYHKPALTNRGKPIAAWCAGKLASGETFVDVMSVDDVERRRKCSQDPDSLMWKHWWDEGAAKTVTRHCCKRLKGNPKLRRALEIEERDYPEITPELPQREMPKRLSETKQVTAEPEPPEGDAGIPDEDQLYETDAWRDAFILFCDTCKELGWDEKRTADWAKSAKLDTDPLTALKRGIEDRQKELKQKRDLEARKK